MTLLATAKAAKDADPASAQLFEIISTIDAATREPAGELAKPYVLAPLRPMVGDPAKVPPSRFRFTPEDLSKIWGWMARHLAKDMVETAKKCRQPEPDPIWFEFRRTAGKSLTDAIQAAERVPKDMTALLKRFGGGEAKGMLVDAASLLTFSEEISASMKTLPDKIPEFDPDLVEQIREMHEKLSEETPEAALWVLLLTIGRLEQPWQIFRVVAKIGNREDDLVVSKTDLAAVGDAILADTGFFAAKLKMPPQTLEEAKVSANLFDQFVAHSSGMTAEFGIRKAGRWGQVLFSLRAEASSNVEKILNKIPLALDSGLPEPRRGRSGRIIPAQLPSEANIDRAEGLLYFLNRCREHTNAAAIASSHKRVMDIVEKRMAEAGGMLVDLVASSEGQNRTTAQDGLEITARLLDAAGFEEQAGLLRRRGLAAAA
ncbi:hypothetical protein [Maricaulis parjimensis]|uniref:hypothetical protein n=1 Tax=Maricaulis parjimensis TaxID=144023 RepID=UPI001939649F|nr:hypothetical protein [Maricaulis parjimensis]